MTTLNADGNILGRLGALALLAAAGFGLHRLNCSGGVCPAVKTEACCGFVQRAAAHQAAAAPAPAVPAK